MELDFSDQVAVVTGGASGIGEACAALLAGAGARVIVADRNEAAAQAVAKAIGGIALTLDVGEEASVEALVAAVQARCGVPSEMNVSAPRRASASRVISSTCIGWPEAAKSESTTCSAESRRRSGAAKKRCSAAAFRLSPVEARW